ncbi:MAG: DUF4407 domain-containing protein [Cyclobacteriaceae bacterium]
MDRLKNFFWSCAGTNQHILVNCPTDSSKYVGIGATVFFTGVFAALSGGYALFTIFDSIWIAVAFGLLWGLMIFNLDRFIVSSMRKSDQPRKELFTALPRLVLAVLISIVIAKPLELKMFDKEINGELALMSQEHKALEEQSVRYRFESENVRLNQEVTALKNEINVLAEKRDELRIIAQQEADGTGGSGKRNAGPIYQIKKADADRVEEELKALRSTNDLLIAEKLNAIAKNNELALVALASLEEQNLNGLASRLDALGRLTEKSSAIWLANIFILFLFLAIETAPIFVKLISSKGPYDYLLKVEEYGFEAEHFEGMAKVNSEIKKRSAKLSQEEMDYVLEKLALGLKKG